MYKFSGHCGDALVKGGIKVIPGTAYQEEREFLHGDFHVNFFFAYNYVLLNFSLADDFFSLEKIGFSVLSHKGLRALV